MAEQKEQKGISSGGSGQQSGSGNPGQDKSTDQNKGTQDKSAQDKGSQDRSSTDRTSGGGNR